MPQVPWIDINDNGQTADSDQVQQYLDNLRDAVNSLDEDNVNPSSQIALLDQDETVTGTWTFNTPPVISSPLDESAIPHTFSNAVTFNGGITTAGITNTGQIVGLFVEQVSALPTSGTAGQIVYDTSQNKFFGWNGSNWVELSYTGGYTGGALRPYSGEVIVDDDNPKKIVFKVDSTSTAVKLFLRGTKFPSAFYRELGEHNHGLSAVTITNTVSDSGHTHDVTLGSHTHTGSFATSDHTHTIYHRHWLNLTSSITGAHDHGGYTGSIDVGLGTGSQPHAHTISSDGDHSHTVSGYTSYDNTTSSSPSGYASVGTTDLGTVTSASATTGISVSSSISGSTDNAGVNGGTLSTTVKTYAKGLTILVNGTDITSVILTATGWTEIGDGTDTHAFVTSGTGEIDIFSYCITGINYIEIQEPNSGYGGGVLYHIDVY